MRPAIRASPPFAPPPATTTISSASEYRSSTAVATAAPARSINCSTSCPSSAARISSAV